MKPLKQILREERERYGWTQTELDERAKLPRGTTNHFETGYRKTILR